MILVDENIDARIIASLRASDIEVYSIEEHHRGVLDEKVIEISKDLPGLY